MNRTRKKILLAGITGTTLVLATMSWARVAPPGAIPTPRPAYRTYHQPTAPRTYQRTRRNNGSSYNKYRKPGKYNNPGNHYGKYGNPGKHKGRYHKQSYNRTPSYGTTLTAHQRAANLEHQRVLQRAAAVRRLQQQQALAQSQRERLARERNQAAWVNSRNAARNQSNWNQSNRNRSKMQHHAHKKHH